jgi:prepilin-type N-terminal cleavage/methylation domain-containing protein
MTSKNPAVFPPRIQAGFTLIELLVVIGLIAVLAGGIGLALGKSNRGTSLQSAQATLSSALSGARAQSALTQSNAAIFVNADPTSDNFLREFRIAIDTDPSSTTENWQVRGDPILLPSGIYLVPPGSPAAFPNTQVNFQNTWTNLYTTTYKTTVVALKDSANNPISLVSYNLISSFKVQGTTSTGQLVLSPGELQSGGKIVLDNPDFVRGLVISQYGVATFINEAAAFN